MQVLSVIERFFLASHDAGLGLGATFAIGVAADVPTESIREAWSVLGDRYPIVRSVLVRRHWLRDGWSGFAWKERHDRTFEPLFAADDRAVDAAESLGELLDRQLERWGNTPHSLDTEPPVQLVVVRHPRSGTGFILRIHHAALDGIALAVLSQDLMEILDDLTHGRVPNRDQARIASRGMGRYYTAVGARGLVGALVGQARIRRWNRPRANDALPVEWTKRDARTHGAKELIHPSAVAEIRAAARAQGISINDAVLAAVARACHAFSSERRVRMRKITLSVPINLRAYRGLEPRESIANQGISVEIFVPGRLVDARDELLHAIRAQTRELKGTPLPLVTLARSMLIFGLPYRLVVSSLRRLLTVARIPRTTPTVTVSNVGPIWQRPDGSTLETMGGSPVVYVRHLYQCGYPMPATIALYTYRGEIQMEMSFAAGGLTRDEANALLRRVRAELFALLRVEDVHGRA